MICLSTLLFVAALGAEAPAATSPPEAPPSFTTPHLLSARPLSAPVFREGEDAAEKKEPHWTGSVNVGTSFVTGNTETTSFNATFDAELRREKDRYTVGAFFNYSEQKDAGTGENVETENKAGVNGKYDRFVSEKTYWLVSSRAEKDKLADVDLRFQIGAGLGRQFKEEEKLKLSGEAGLSWFKEELGTGVDSDYIAARLASKVEWIFKEGYKLSNSTEVFPSVEDTSDIYGKTDTRVAVQLNEDLLAQLQWVLDYDNTPAAGADRVDSRVMITLGWIFGK